MNDLKMETFWIVFRWYVGNCSYIHTRFERAFSSEDAKNRAMEWWLDTHPSGLLRPHVAVTNHV